MGLSTSQFISLILAPLSLIMLVYLRRRLNSRARKGRKACGLTVNRQELLVPPEEAGVRIDRYLTNVLGGHSRSQIQRLIKDGQVTVTGQDRATEPRGACGRNDRCRHSRADESNASAGSSRPRYRVSGSGHRHRQQACGHGRPSRSRSRAGHARQCAAPPITDLSGIGGELRPGIVHRLDRDTSGLMVVAKNDRAHAELARQFHDREVEKEYVALVWGVVQAGRRIDLPDRARSCRSEEDVGARTAGALSHDESHQSPSYAGRLAPPRRDLNRPYASNPCSSERDRPSHRRRHGVRRFAPARARRSSAGPRARPTVPPCRTVWCFITPPTDVRWNSRRPCLTTCSRCSI